MTQRVSVVITDLDNTLFDWVGIWHQSFNAMLQRLVSDSGVAQEILEPEFKAIHEKYGTSEYAFSIQELPSLQKLYPGEDLAKKYYGAIEASRQARHNVLHLYDTVLNTLEELKDKGCLIIAYTESMAFYSNRRMRTLGLDRIFDFLYSPEDHDIPSGLSLEDIRRYSPEHYELRRTIHRHTPKGKLKPSPDVLLNIINEVGALVDQTIYIGDNLMKDIVMAKQAGVTNIWAKYGEAQDRPEYELLRRVSHWPDEDVNKEKEKETRQIAAQYELESCFGELLKLFEFVPYKSHTEARTTQMIEVWKTTIEVQQHFNDLELRIRNYAVTLLVAVLGATAYAFKDGIQVTLFGFTTSLSALLLVAAIPGWLAFYFMDRLWYHRLLYGAVSHGRVIEKSLNEVLPGIALTEAIAQASPIQIGRYRLRTPRKIDLFYLVVIAFIVVVFLVYTHIKVVVPTKVESGSAPTTQPSLNPTQ